MSLSSLSRFFLTGMIVAPSLLSCSEGDEPQAENAPKSITGVATEYIVSVGATGGVHAVYMKFKGDQDGKIHKVTLNPAEPGSGRDQAGQTISTDNFLSDRSTVKPNEYNQLLLMKDNKEFNISIDVDSEDRAAVGASSIDVRVPTTLASAFEYVSEDMVIAYADPKNISELHEEVSRVVDLNNKLRLKVILDQ